MVLIVCVLMPVKGFGLLVDVLHPESPSGLGSGCVG